jgi:hypothetical protein
MENLDSLFAIRYSQKALPKQAREKQTGVVPASNPHRACFAKPTKKEDSEAKRRQTQWELCRALRARPRLKREAHDCRRSTAALA